MASRTLYESTTLVLWYLSKKNNSRRATLNFESLWSSTLLPYLLTSSNFGQIMTQTCRVLGFCACSSYSQVERLRIWCVSCSVRLLPCYDRCGPLVVPQLCWIHFIFDNSIDCWVFITEYSLLSIWNLQLKRPKWEKTEAVLEKPALKTNSNWIKVKTTGKWWCKTLVSLWF